MYLWSATNCLTTSVFPAWLASISAVFPNNPSGRLGFKFGCSSSAPIMSRWPEAAARMIGLVLYQSLVCRLGSMPSISTDWTSLTSPALMAEQRLEINSSFFADIFVFFKLGKKKIWNLLDQYIMNNLPRLKCAKSTDIYFSSFSFL